MNVNNLSYSEYATKVAGAWFELLKNGREEDKHNLYELLTADGSDFFYYLSDIMSEKMGRGIDFLCYFLLLSVRTSEELSQVCIERACEIASEVLEEIANEKRE